MSDKTSAVIIPKELKMPGPRGLRPRCSALTSRGERCAAQALRDGLCWKHSPLTAALFQDASEEEVSPPICEETKRKIGEAHRKKGALRG
jgi:hypothetical protein